MDTEAYKLRPSTLSYEVRFGHSLHEKVAFATFELALAFYRGFEKARKETSRYSQRTAANIGECCLVNAANIDGAEDASAASQHGLTQAEWDALQEVG
jgi:hypothetical protein